MNCPEAVDILLIEDNVYDTELFLRSFKKQNIVNPVMIIDLCGKIGNF